MAKAPVAAKLDAGVAQADPAKIFDAEKSHKALRHDVTKLERLVDKMAVMLRVKPD